MLDGLVNQRAAFGFDGNVGANEDGLSALRRDVRGDGPALLFISSRNDHARAFFGEQPDDAFAHSRARSGDDRYFVFQTVHFAIYLSNPL